MRSWLMAACIVAAGLAVQAPAAEEWDLGTDRDAFTPCTHCVAPGVVLVEGSSVFIDNVTGLPTNNYPESLLRIGATEWLEWRFGVNYGVGSQGNVVTSVEVGEGTPDGSTLYESSVLYGLKVNTSAQDGLMPQSCFIMEASTPTYGDVFGTVPVATAVAGWELPIGWRLDTAIRYAYSEGLTDWFSRWTPSAVLRIPVTERFEVHAEWFGSFTAEHRDGPSRRLGPHVRRRAVLLRCRYRVEVLTRRRASRQEASSPSAGNTPRIRNRSAPRPRSPPPFPSLALRASWAYVTRGWRYRERRGPLP